MKKLRGALKWSAVALLALVVAATIAFFVVDEPRPTGREGADADALATRLEKAVDVEAWRRTGAVRWSFAGKRSHLWDRERDLVRVRWSDVEVLLRTQERTGIAYRSGNEVPGEVGTALVEEAYAGWINDSFWLNPIAMFRGEGVSRAAVQLENGDEGLLISYSSGGLTPGDAYLWLAGEDGLPQAWRMWVSIIPVGGVETSWEGWQTLATGARIATRHVGPFGLTLELTNVEGAATLAELVEDDPFAALQGSSP